MSILPIAASHLSNPSRPLNSRWSRAIAVVAAIAVVSATIPAEAVPINWAVDADGDWEVTTNWSSDPVLPGSTDDVTIDRAAGTYTVTVSTISPTVNSLFSNENLILDGGRSFTVKAPSSINGSLEIRSKATLWADGAGASFVANGATTLDGAHVRAKNGGTISLPLATTYSEAANPSFGDRFLEANGTGSMLDLSALTNASSSTGSFSSLRFQAFNGGQVDVSALGGFNLGAGQAIARHAGSIVDLTNLTTFTPTTVFGETSFFEATSGGTVLIPNLVTVDGAGVKLDGTGTMSTSQIVNFNRSVATINGDTPDFSGMTNIDGSNFLASNGGSISAPNANSYDTLTAKNRLFRADGLGSNIDFSTLSNLVVGTWLSTNAFNGGSIDLTGIGVYNSGRLNVAATGALSVVDLSNLTSLTTDSTSSRLEATNGGTIVAPNLTSLDYSGLTLDGTGTMSTSQIATFTNSVATISGGTPDFSGMSNIDASSFFVSGGATVATPAATSYNLSTLASREFKATGLGSSLDLSTVTSMNVTTRLMVNSLSGGSIDLSGLGVYNGGRLDVKANGALSVVDLSNLTSLTTTNSGSRLEATAGGTVVMPNLSFIHLSGITLDGTGTMDTAQIATFTNSRATISGGTPDFSGMTNIDASSFFVSGGATVSLPSVTSYADPANPTFAKRVWEADGVGSTLDLSSITSASASAGVFSDLTARALNGGVVDVSNLATFDIGINHILADGAGSVVDMSSMSTFTPDLIFTGKSRVEATNGGTVRLNVASTDVDGARIIVSPTGTIEVGGLSLMSTATLEGTGTLAAPVNSVGTVTPGTSADETGNLMIDGSFSQLVGGITAIDLEGTSTSDFDILSITGPAILDGTLDVDLLGSFTPMHGDSFTILSAAGGVTGMFGTELLPALPGTLDWQILYGTNDVTLLAVDPTIVPEPSTIVLALFGMGGLVLAYRRRQRGQR